VNIFMPVHNDIKVYHAIEPAQTGFYFSGLK
jgi:hypothetical protein